MCEATYERAAAGTQIAALATAARWVGHPQISSPVESQVVIMLANIVSTRKYIFDVDCWVSNSHTRLGRCNMINIAFLSPYSVEAKVRLAALFSFHIPRL